MAMIAEGLVWWVVLVLLELVLVGPVDRNELLLAAGAAATASVAGLVGRRATGRRYPLALADLRPLVRVPGALVPETVQLARLALSRQRPIGHWRQRRPADRVETGPHPTVAAAVWTVGQSATPGAFIAEVDEREARVHVLRRRAEG
jgi:hypothetical protein